MEIAEQIIRLLNQATTLMMGGKFSKMELEFIKSGLIRMLEATENVLTKATDR